MGHSSSKLLELDADIKSLKEQLEEIKGLDRNNDGIITKDEFREWKNEQKNKMLELERKVEEQVTGKYTKMLIEKETLINNIQRTNDELNKQINSLKTMNSALEAKLLHETTINNPEGIQKLQELSKRKIDEYVEQLLTDETVNISYLPDFVEKKIYKNVFSLLIGLLNNVLGTTAVKLLGHQLTFMITPDNSELIMKPKELVIETEKEVIDENQMNETLKELVNETSNSHSAPHFYQNEISNAHSSHSAPHFYQNETSNAHSSHSAPHFYQNETDKVIIDENQINETLKELVIESRSSGIINEIPLNDSLNKSSSTENSNELLLDELKKHFD